MTLDLAGAVPDPLDPGVAPPAFGRKGRHQAHAAEDLYGRVRHPAQHLRGIQLGHRRVGVGHRALIALGRGPQCEQIGRFQRRGTVGQLEPYALEAAYRLAELTSGGRPLGDRLQHPAGAADAGGGDRQPGRAQPLTHEVEAAPLLAQQVPGRDAAIGEGQLALVIAAVRHALRTPGDGQAGGVLVDQERGNLLLRAVPTARGGEQDDKVGHVGVADEVLGAVDDVVVPVPAGRRGHGADVRAGARFGHRDAVVPLTADGGEQVALPLVGVATLQDVARPLDQHLQGVAGPAQLAFGQDQGHRVQPAAAQLGGHVGRVQPGGDRLGADLAGQLRGTSSRRSTSASCG